MQRSSSLSSPVSAGPGSLALFTTATELQKMSSENLIFIIFWNEKAEFVLYDADS